MKIIKILFILLLFVFIGISCEKDPVNDDNDLISSTDLDFHNPSSIALVKARGETAKKSRGKR